MCFGSQKGTLAEVCTKEGTLARVCLLRGHVRAYFGSQEGISAPFDSKEGRLYFAPKSVVYLILKSQRGR